MIVFYFLGMVCALVVLLCIGAIIIIPLLQAISLIIIESIAHQRFKSCYNSIFKWHKLPKYFVETYWDFFKNYGFNISYKTEYYEWSGIFKFKIYPQNKENK